MSEDALRAKVRAELAPWGALVRVEDRYSTGTADVCYCLRAGIRGASGSGWLELKYERAWPARAATPFRIETLEKEQVDFAAEWVAAGGRAWFLAQVGRGYWLFDPCLARDVRAGAVVADEFRRRSAVGHPTRFSTGDILRALVR